MAKTKLLKISRGPLPGAPEPCVTLELHLTNQEVDQALKGKQRLTNSLLPWLEVSLNASASNQVQAGEFIVQLARALLNEHGGVITTATCQPVGANLNVTLGYHHPKVSAQALACALGIALSAENLSAQQLAQHVEALWKEAHPFTPDPIAHLLITEAKKASLPVRPYHWPTRQWLFGWGARSETFFEAAPRSDSHAGRNLSSDKQLSKLLATACGFRVLPSYRVGNINDLDKAASVVGFPCVVKPIQGKQGKGVTTNITSLAELREAWKLAQQLRPIDVLVERHAEGEVYRLMVIRGEFVCSIIRPRPSVQADGQSTLLQLAQKRNQPLIAKSRPSSYSKPTPLDQLFVNCLRRQGFKPDSIPEAGRKIYLRDAPLVSHGVTDIADVTQQTHPNIKAAAIDLSNMLGIDCCGIDLVSTDISQETSSYFLEVNGTPGIRLMTEAGMPAREVALKIIGPKPARIPTLLMIAPTANQEGLLEALQQKSGLGWSLGGKVGIGVRLLSTEQRLAHDHIELLVRNPSAKALVSVIEPETLVTHGLPLDHWDRILLAPQANLPSDITQWLQQQGYVVEWSVDLPKLTAAIQDLKTD